MSGASFAAKYEEPTYTVVETHPGFELRDYGSRLLAEVTMSGARDEAASDAFRVLAAYIFSKNTPEGSPIGMTIPVGQYEAEGEWRMWFSMPSRYSSEGSVADAKALADNLGIELMTIPIEPEFNAFLESLAGPFAGTEPGVAAEKAGEKVDEEAE